MLPDFAGGVRIPLDSRRCTGDVELPGDIQQRGIVACRILVKRNFCFTEACPGRVVVWIVLVVDLRVSQVVARGRQFFCELLQTTNQVSIVRDNASDCQCNRGPAVIETIF